MKGKQPTTKNPSRSSRKMPAMGHNPSAKGKAGNRSATMTGWPYARNKKY